MAKASDNAFPSLLLVEGSAPTTPAAGRQRLFVDTADGLLKLVDDAGTVTTIGSGGGGGFGAWTAYTPTLTATSTNPTLGSGSTASGRYRSAGDDGIEGMAHFVFGSSGVAAGGGEYLISLPAGVTLPGNVTTNETVGAGWCFDNSTGTARTLTVARASSTALRAYVDSGAIVTNAAPFGWAANDILSVRFAAECAFA